MLAGSSVWWLALSSGSDLNPAEANRGQPSLGCHAVILGGVTAAGPPDPMVCSLEASLAESGVILPGQLQ